MSDFGDHQPKHVTALNLQEPAQLDPDIEKYFAVCEEKLGMVPNVLKAYAFDQNKLRNFMNFYNELMLGESGLSKLEREMIAVAVSAVNHCVYCLAAHGATVRQLSGDATLGDLLVMNYRVAELEPRQRAMLDFAVKMTERPAEMSEADRQSLRDHGFSDADIFDIAATAGFFNMTNRVASAVDMMPNTEYYRQAR